MDVTACHTKLEVSWQRTLFFLNLYSIIHVMFSRVYYPITPANDNKKEGTVKGIESATRAYHDKCFYTSRCNHYVSKHFDS